MPGPPSRSRCLTSTIPGRAMHELSATCARAVCPHTSTATAYDQHVRSFRIEVAEADLTGLRDRIARTRWPDPATVGGWTQGVPLDYARDLCDYWRTRYDWRRCEAELNALPQFCTSLDGGGDDAVDVHFLHVRSRHADALPLLFTHGWPGSIVEFLDVVDALTDPPDPRDAFHLVIPSLPGYGFSGKPTHAGWGVERIAV